MVDCSFVTDVCNPKVLFRRCEISHQQHSHVHVFFQTFMLFQMIDDGPYLYQRSLPAACPDGKERKEKIPDIDCDVSRCRRVCICRKTFQLALPLTCCEVSHVLHVQLQLSRVDSVNAHGDGVAGSRLGGGDVEDRDGKDDWRRLWQHIGDGTLLHQRASEDEGNLVGSALSGQDGEVEHPALEEVEAAGVRYKIGNTNCVLTSAHGAAGVGDGTVLVQQCCEGGSRWGPDLYHEVRVSPQHEGRVRVPWVRVPVEAVDVHLLPARCSSSLTFEALISLQVLGAFNCLPEGSGAASI
mmetsp:Transcript_3521/g.12284  ORF Transcript_3521/g.12284 Transcript_3521/m.12284 type:complete len:297 (-) Transcript_3521:139-1029(-)